MTDEVLEPDPPGTPWHRRYQLRFRGRTSVDMSEDAPMDEQSNRFWLGFVVLLISVAVVMVVVAMVGH